MSARITMTEVTKGDVPPTDLFDLLTEKIEKAGFYADPTTFEYDLELHTVTNHNGAWVSGISAVAKMSSLDE